MARGVAKKGEVERKKGPFDILKNASQQCTSEGMAQEGRGSKREKDHPIRIALFWTGLLSKRDDRIARPNGEE
jgi:hypothetical protein